MAMATIFLVGSADDSMAQRRKRLSKKSKGALIGAGAGAVVGGVTGGKKGAVIGTAAGAGGGYLYGRKRQKKTGTR